MDAAKTISADIGVLGGGPAGYTAAIRAAQLGAKVVMIEESKPGGVCLNVGCIPTKALLKTAETASSVKRSKEYGVESSLGAVDWNTAAGRKDRIVKQLTSGIGHLLAARDIIVLNGRGTVLPDKRLSVQTGEETVEVNCGKLILATGSAPLIPGIEGINLDGVITSTEALSLTSLPESVVIIGAGVIGLEFADMFHSAGVKVTVVELAERILPGEDSEAAAELLKTMKRKGIAFKLSARVTEIRQSDGGLAVAYTMGEKAYAEPCEKVLASVGRKLNTGAFQALSLHMEKGAVCVNESMETGAEGVYAAGDITGGKLLAHLAFMEGKTAAENAMGLCSRVNYNAVPACVYTSPELASVGITEEQAALAGMPVKVGRFHFRSNGRALTLGEREGFVKVVAGQDGTILGGQILCANASEMISELTLAVALRAKTGDLVNMIHPHPTLSEAIWEACGDILGMAIHK